MIELPSIEVTSYGMKCRFPVAEVDGITIAVLLAETYDEHLGMILHPAEESELQDPTRKMYYIAWPFKTAQRAKGIRRNGTQRDATRRDETRQETRHKRPVLFRARSRPVASVASLRGTDAHSSSASRLRLVHIVLHITPDMPYCFACCTMLL